MHIDTVVRACAAWRAGDISVYREMYASDVVASGGQLWPEREDSVAGVDALMQNFESLMQAFERSELIPEAYVEEGDSLVVRLLWRGVVRASEAPVEQRVTCAYRFRDGLIAYTAWSADLAQALDAVGLPRSAAKALRTLDAGPPDAKLPLADAAQSAASAS
jgi:ketosteroid isomerase-like protein